MTSSSDLYTIAHFWYLSLALIILFIAIIYYFGTRPGKHNLKK